MKTLLLGLAILTSLPTLAMSYIEGCGRYTYTTKTERLCIKLQVPAKISQACYNYTYTTSNEKYCLKNHKNLTPQKIYDCGRYTTTTSAEADCLYPDRGWFE
ncbi:MAG: hypothetical protein QF441_09745 [Bacteriovoracaceae bacterium]|jgi:hypothetical protein|nr:hypothetical protein [Bacteriovoracaceae bacterium]